MLHVFDLGAWARKGVGEPDASQPENHQDQWQETQQHKDVRSGEESRKELWPRQEYRRSRNKQREAHAPRVPGDPLHATNAAAQ
jgi:hypothetical protein